MNNVTSVQNDAGEGEMFVILLVTRLGLAAIKSVNVKVLAMQAHSVCVQVKKYFKKIIMSVGS